ncbi:hypothetical protein BGZ81_010511 [Podila clonocystis]|nr:hypothetical protein BGZ81_010511 [Podila clonocystis]
MHVDDEPVYQTLTATNSNRTSYAHFQYQSGMGQTMFANPGTALLDASAGQAYARVPSSSLDMFKSNLSSYLTSSGSTTSESSSKSLITAGVSSDSSDERFASRTSNQDMEDLATSETVAQQRSRPSHEANQPLTFQSDMPHESSLIQTSPFSRSLLQQHQQLSQGIWTTTMTSSSSPSSTDVTESPEDITIRRAEQNRAAQRAFRQRKQKYIKWLESKAEELDEVYRIMALVRTENQQLCNLVIGLNARLNSLDPTKPNMSPTAAIPSSGSAPSLSSSALNDTFKSISTLTALKSLDRSTSDGTQQPDDSLGREISMTLMSLATFPGLEATGGREATITGKFKYQPHSIGLGKGCSAKGKMAFKSSQQFKQQHQKKEQQQRQQHQNQHKLQQQTQPHPPSRVQTPTASSPKRTDSPLPHLNTQSTKPAASLGRCYSNWQYTGADLK